MSEELVMPESEPVEATPETPYEEYIKMSGATDTPEVKAAFEAGFAVGRSEAYSGPAGQAELPPDLDR